MLNSRFQKEPPTFGQWNMGKLGLPVNVFAIIYTAYVIIWFPFPSELPVSGENMNYSLPIFGASTLFALSFWFLRARKHWPGLNKEVIRLVVEGGEINLKQ